MSRIRDWLRYPHTAQELRAGAVRSKRARLPTAWDDRRRCVQRTWKVHRKTRYRHIAAR
jgi:hypothetical protein